MEQAIGYLIHPRKKSLQQKELKIRPLVVENHLFVKTRRWPMRLVRPHLLPFWPFPFSFPPHSSQYPFGHPFDSLISKFFNESLSFQSMVVAVVACASLLLGAISFSR
ncbi:hypothetical protein AAMO2058_001645800 [Amorphochlora amoebiformis]